MGEQEQELIRLVSLPLKELAEELGVSYAAVRNYAAGRPIPSTVRVKLARFAEKHAKRLERAAADLRASE